MQSGGAADQGTFVATPKESDAAARAFLPGAPGIVSAPNFKKDVADLTASRGRRPNGRRFKTCGGGTAEGSGGAGLGEGMAIPSGTVLWLNGGAGRSQGGQLGPT